MPFLKGWMMDIDTKHPVHIQYMDSMYCTYLHALHSQCLCCMVADVTLRNCALLAEWDFLFSDANTVVVHTDITFKCFMIIVVMYWTIPMLTLQYLKITRVMKTNHSHMNSLQLMHSLQIPTVQFVAFVCPWYVTFSQHLVLCSRLKAHLCPLKYFSMQSVGLGVCNLCRHVCLQFTSKTSVQQWWCCALVERSKVHDKKKKKHQKFKKTFFKKQDKKHRKWIVFF